MQKKTPDYDNVFKTMKSKHKRLFISVINDVFRKEYPLDSKIEVLPSEGYLTEGETGDGSKHIKEQIAEYTFIVGRKFATWDIGYANIPMPQFSIVYVKKSNRTPKNTKITFTFPDGQTVNYESPNIILEEFTKEYIIEKKLFPYIPFYITRYENQLTKENKTEDVIRDLEYFRNEMIRLHKAKELSDDEIVDLMGFINTIITHITNGNQNEERLVGIMGGTVIETESEKLIRKGKEIGEEVGKEIGKEIGKVQMIIEMGQEYGLDDGSILKKLQEKTGISLEEAAAYLEQYGKKTV